MKSLNLTQTCQYEPCIHFLFLITKVELMGEFLRRSLKKKSDPSDELIEQLLVGPALSISYELL